MKETISMFQHKFKISYERIWIWPISIIFKVGFSIVWKSWFKTNDSDEDVDRLFRTTAIGIYCVSKIIKIYLKMLKSFYIHLASILSLFHYLKQFIQTRLFVSNHNGNNATFILKLLTETNKKHTHFKFTSCCL